MSVGSGRGPRRRTRLFRPGARRGVDAEIAHHIDERTDRLIAEGWTPEAARVEAERRFGRVDRYRVELLTIGKTDEGRRWIVETFAGLVQDVRQALRGIRREPRFASALILTIALGVGATGAIFSVLDTVMWRPLPYEDPDRLVEIYLELAERDMTIPELLADQVGPYIENADFLLDWALHDRISVVRTDGPHAENLQAIAGSPSLGPLLGVRPIVGRLFTEDEGRPGARVALLTHSYWSRLGSDPDVLGESMRLDGEPWTIVGVLPPGFKFPVAGRGHLWVPLSEDYTAAGRSLSQLGVVGRLSDGVTLEAAQRRADALAASLAESVPNRVGWQTRVVSITDWRGNADTKQGLWMLAGAVGLMFVIALVNGTNLLLVRAQSRVGEVGVRRALGASRARLLRQVVVESLLLAGLAGVVATGFAWSAVRGIGAIAPSEITFSMVYDFGLEARALAVVFATATFAGLAVGAIPALRLAAARAAGAGPSRGRNRDRKAHRLRSALVALEVGVSVVLLVGAGLFIRSFVAMTRVDLGADVDRLAHAEVQLPPGRYSSDAERGAFATSVLERLRALPGVEGAVVSQGIPPEGGGISVASGLQGEGAPPVGDFVLVPYAQAEPGYVELLGASIVAGRALQPRDLEADGVLVDRDLARLLFGVDDVAGRRFRLSDSQEGWMTVVGVVDELKLGGPDDRIAETAIVYPMDPVAPPAYLDFAVRTQGDPVSVLTPMREAIRAVDPELPLEVLETGRGSVSEALTRPRFLVLLMGVLAGLALVLAAVGLFGVLSYAVDQRRHEMGVRIALGAPPPRVRGRVVRWGMSMAALGTLLGLGVATALDDLAEALLYRVRPGDPATLVGVVATMLGVAALACWLPARRASRVDPLEVLRAE